MMHLVRDLAVLGIALLAFGVFGSAAARADLYLSAPHQLEPVPPGPGESTSAYGTFECTVSWATVASAPSGYAVGNCASGVHLHRQAKSGLTDTGYYDGGNVYGAFAGCGWIGVDSDGKLNDTEYHECPVDSIGYSLSEFAAYTDGCQGTSSCSGTPIDNVGTCYEYANVRPWLSGQTATGFLRAVIPHSTYNGAPRLAWRYVTKYATSDAWAQQFVMVRDRAISPGSGNWVFVPLACI